MKFLALTAFEFVWIPWSFLSYTSAVFWFWIHLVQFSNSSADFLIDFTKIHLGIYFLKVFIHKISPFKYKRFLFDEMTKWNVSKLAIFQEYEKWNPMQFFHLFLSTFLWFWFFWIMHPIRCLVGCIIQKRSNLRHPFPRIYFWLLNTWSLWTHGIVCGQHMCKFGTGNLVFQGPKWNRCSANKKLVDVKT